MKDKKKFIFSALRILLGLFGLGIVVNVHIFDSNEFIEQIISKGGILKDLNFLFFHVVTFALFISLVSPWSPKGALKYENYTFKLCGYIGLISWLYFSVKFLLRMIV